MTKPVADERERERQARLQRIRRAIDRELRAPIPDKLRPRKGDTPALRTAKLHLLENEARWQALSPEERARRWAIIDAKRKVRRPIPWDRVGMPTVPRSAR